MSAVNSYDALEFVCGKHAPSVFIYGFIGYEYYYFFSIAKFDLN